jgi:hypothetical protein
MCTEQSHFALQTLAFNACGFVQVQGFQAALPKTFAPSAGAPTRFNGNTHCNNV